MRVLLCSLMLMVSAVGLADEFVVMGYNVESDDDTKWTTVAEDMASLGHVDIWGLSEVQNRAAVRIFRNAAKQGSDSDDPRYYYLLGENGRSDRLAIIYNEHRFEHLDVYELIDEVGGDRPPLVAHMRDLDTGLEFLFMVNHLNRGDSSKRQRQALGLRIWAESIDLPVVAMGDYNFDWDVTTERGNKAFRYFMEGEHWDWIEPNCALDNDFSDCQPTQCNPNYTSILDFLFVAGEAKNWFIQSEILEPRPDYCDFDGTGGADHLPIIGIVTPSP
ncbi:MAG: endonuclease/exonuclease/phosphatase family protein [Pseudomonadota bacterium]